MILNAAFFLVLLWVVYHRTGVLMTAADDIKAALTRIEEAASNIADDIRDLLARATTPGISEADAAEIKAQGEALATRIEGIAGEYTPPTA